MKQAEVNVLYQVIGRELDRIEQQSEMIEGLRDSLIDDLTGWHQRASRFGCPGETIDLDQLDELGGLRTLRPGNAAGPVQSEVQLPTRREPTPSQSDLWDYDCGSLHAEIAAYHAELDATAAEDQRLLEEVRRWSSGRAAVDHVTAELIEGWAAVEREFRGLQSWWETMQGTGQMANWGGVVAGALTMPYLAIGLGVVSLASSLASSHSSPSDALRILRARHRAAFARVRVNAARLDAERRRANLMLGEIRRPLESRYSAIQAKRRRCALQPGLAAMCRSTTPSHAFRGSGPRPAVATGRPPTRRSEMHCSVVPRRATRWSEASGSSGC